MLEVLAPVTGLTAEDEATEAADEPEVVDSVTGLATLLLGTTAVAVVAVTALDVVSMVEVTLEYAAGEVSELLAVAGPTGTGPTDELGPEEEPDCEPTTVKP